MQGWTQLRVAFNFNNKNTRINALNCLWGFYIYATFMYTRQHFVATATSNWLIYRNCGTYSSHGFWCVSKFWLRHIWWSRLGAGGRATSKSWSGYFKVRSWRKWRPLGGPARPLSSPSHLGRAQIAAPWSLHPRVCGSSAISSLGASHQLYPLLVSRICCQRPLEQGQGGQQTWNIKSYLSNFLQ